MGSYRTTIIPLQISWSVWRTSVSRLILNLIIVFVILFYLGTEGNETIFWCTIVPFIPNKYASKYNIRYWKLSALKYPEGNIIHTLLNKFFNKELVPNKNYLFKLKVKLDDGRWIGFHRSVVVSKETFNEYLKFLSWQRSLKIDKVYNDESLYQVIAIQFYKLPDSPESASSTLVKSNLAHISNSPSVQQPGGMSDGDQK